jgi:hypothetical protein
LEIQLSELSIKANRCRQHYLAVFTDQQQFANKSQALDEALQHFLNQRPVGKDISWLDRATGLAAAPFWREADVVKAVGEEGFFSHEQCLQLLANVGTKGQADWLLATYHGIT